MARFISTYRVFCAVPMISNLLMTSTIWLLAGSAWAAWDESPTAGDVFQDSLHDVCTALNIQTPLCLGPEMVVIPKGQATVGDIRGACAHNDCPASQVTVDQPFAVSRYEITGRDYYYYLKHQKRLHGYKGVLASTKAVVGISWYEAQDYVHWLSRHSRADYQLPTEELWEYMARSGSETAYWWGEQMEARYSACRFACPDHPFKYGQPVGYFPANFFGVFDTAGSVWEWTASIFAPSEKNPQHAPLMPHRLGQGSPLMTIRGGSLVSGHQALKSHYRTARSADYKNDHIGFRVIRTCSNAIEC